MSFPSLKRHVEPFLIFIVDLVFLGENFAPLWASGGNILVLGDVALEP
jgi:hypothetical protein